MNLVFQNNATTVLALDILSNSTTITVAAGTGSLFPSLSANQYFVATLSDPTGLINEIVWVTAVTADVFTVIRAQEGTTALAWSVGTAIQNLWTAGQAAVIWGKYSGAVSPTAQFGFSTDPTVDNGPALEAMLTYCSANGLSPIIDRYYSVLSARNVTGLNLSIECLPGGGIQWGPNGSMTFTNCTGLVRGLNMIGSLSSPDQYLLYKSGVTTAFQSGLTYNDGTNPIDGSDFTHVLQGNVFSINPCPAGVANTAYLRNVVSDFIPLNPNNRYVIYVQKGWQPNASRAPVSVTNAVWASTAGGQTTLTVASDLTASVAVGSYVNVFGIVNSGGTSTSAFNGSWVVVSITSTTIVVSQPALSSPGTYTSGGNVFPGQGATTPVFNLYDNGKNFIGTFDPQTTDQNGSITALITGASYMKMQIGAYSPILGVKNLTTNYDLTKIIVYQCVNDLATQPLNVSPQFTGHVYLTNCTNLLWEGGTSTMMNRCNIKMYGCKNTVLKDISARYVLHGPVDDHGDYNSFDGMNIDLRLGDSAGNLIGSRAFRQRCMGGAGSNHGRYCRNKGIGASWACEFLPGDPTYVNYFYQNEIYAEFAAASLPYGFWHVDSNVLSVSPTGLYGMELPLIDGAMVTDQQIIWDDLCWIGFGYSPTRVGVQNAVIRGGSIKAPYGFNYITDAGGSLYVADTEIETGGGAMVARSASAYFEGVRLRVGAAQYPYGSLASGGLFDFGPQSVNYELVIERCNLPTTVYPTVYVYATQNFSFRDNTVVSDGAITQAPIYFSMLSAYVCSLSFLRNTLTSSFPTIPFLQLIGLFFDGTTIQTQDNFVSGSPYDIPQGTYPNSALVGAIYMRGYLLNYNPGTIAPGAISSPVTVTVAGLSTGDFCAVVPYSATGYPGLVPNAIATADDTATVTLFNPGTNPVTPTVQSIYVAAQKQV